MTPAYLSDQLVAHLLGRKVTWLRRHRPQLEADGFPAKDALIGQTNRADIETWIARRRRLPDPEVAQHSVAANTTKARINHDKL